MTVSTDLHPAHDPAHGPDPAPEGLHHLKPPIDPATLVHRNFRRDEYWRKIPAWKDVDHETFADYDWQEKHAITSPKKLVATVRELVSEAFVKDVEGGFAVAPMAVRISPYLLSLIDWEAPVDDPIRRQFLPLASEIEPDHPMLTLDSLHEQGDAPVPGLTHRYPDKALFLALDTCPVYCRFCTRSYAVGLDTDTVDKVSLKADTLRWTRAFQYMRERPELEDIVVSGGDAYRLKPQQILEIGHTLLDIPHIRRFRFATKGLAVVPMRVRPGDPWTEAITEVVERARKLGKEVVIHTHFNHPNEATGFSMDAARTLSERGIFVRNQSVLQRGVNDAIEDQITLARKLSYINIHPYYVYVHDLVKGVEALRTTVATAIRLEKRLRGAQAGFNTPTFVVDALGGGGKRDAHSFEHYDQETGISVFSAPSVKEGRLFTYFDPLSELSPHMRDAWADERRRHQMIHDALSEARRKAIA
ncbi:MAG: KamA family radical SAM protein [Deltaproteobacteria bacterium]|nr:KamA family radical SAM protein [Deltaproteobacteria bacterium]